MRPSPLYTVSVIIPTHNRAHTLARAIDSVRRQTLKGWELIVVDDGSSDHTSSVLGAYPVKVISWPEQRGVSAARNAGAAAAKGEWLAFLDSDDEWLPHKLAAQLELARRSPVPLVHTEEIWMRKGRRVNPGKRHRKGGGDIFERSLELCLISPSAAMIRRDSFAKLGGFDEALPVCEDYDLWLRLTSLYPVGFVPQACLLKHGGHPDQLSGRFACMDHWRVRSLERLLGARSFAQARRQKVIREMLRKARILEQGYKKRNNLRDLPYVQGIIKRFSWEMDGRG